MTNTFEEANRLLRENKITGAIDIYSDLIKLDKGFSPYKQNLAVAYQKVGDLSNASKALRDALSLNPWAPWSFKVFSDIEKSRQNKRKDDENPFLSIIVPVYNSGKYLRKCLDSILNQSFKDFELIIVNDGSTDGSWGIIKDYQKKDKRIRVISNQEPSGNPGTPRNQALNIAGGQYIGFVDSDDWLDSNFYSTLCAKAIDDASDIVFSGGFKNCTESRIEIRKYNNDVFNNIEARFYKYHDSFMIWDKIFKAEMVRHSDAWLADTKAAVDVPFIFKVYYFSHLVSFCNELVGYNYRRESESSVTVNFRKKSDCQFEFSAYHNIENWAASMAVPQYYLDIIRIKKLNSYLYTLSIISEEYFDQFFDMAKAELSLIDRSLIDSFSIDLKKRKVFKNFEFLLSATAREYWNYLGRDKTPAHEKQLGLNAKLYIPGEKNGILFFPAWTKSNPYQQMFYQAINNVYGLRISGYDQQYLSKKLLFDNKSKYDYVHLHWLHVFLETSSPNGADNLIEIINYAKRIGYKIIYTAHNIISHESKNIDNERELRRTVVPLFDLVFAHGEYAKQRLITEVGCNAEKIRIVKHGCYTGFYENVTDPKTARKTLGIDDNDFVFLFLGNIRGYKGVDKLIHSFDEVSNSVNKVKLIVCGRVFDESAEAFLRQACEKNKSIIFRPGFVDDRDLQLYFNASDVTVLPYRNILSSGAAMLSLTFGVPVIAPMKGVLPEIMDDSDFGCMFSDYSEMLDLMRQIASEPRTKKNGDRDREYISKKVFDKFNWSKSVGGLVL
ncbi:glycosyltransferase [Halomonas sp. SpR8]|uniref:glycosyltransferase n=1 Tax=Halomonas sp. SpR8 TaxID=3050463 RepID=UPI0027E4F120|nr:glycosyltransferase [Halomonas sp. SpR8]MDQ7727284.1 glycosyltransferase [Halomonas sp. SpR8]